MAKWYEGAEQSAFKRIPNGYLAQLPTRNFIGQRQSYLVNAAQMAEIAAVLRDQRRLMIYMGVLCAVSGAAFGLLAGIWHLTPSDLFYGLLVLVALIMVAMAVVPTAYVRRRLGPLLATLQPTDLRIPFREQVESVARNISGKVIAIGIASGVLMIVGNLMTLADAAYEGRRLGIMVVGNAIYFLVGGVLIAYFIWLIVLRNRPNGNSA